MRLEEFKKSLTATEQLPTVEAIINDGKAEWTRDEQNPDNQLGKVKSKGIEAYFIIDRIGEVEANPEAFKVVKSKKAETFGAYFIVPDNRGSFRAF